MTSAHAFLPPSGANGWVNCAEWAHMNARYPEAGDDPSVAEGVAAHWVLTQSTLPAIGTKAPNGVEVTDEMLEGAELWRDVTDGNQPGDHDEQRVGYAPGVMNWGTPDKWRYKTGLLEVFDYKFGHKPVEAFGNWQLLNYASLIIGGYGCSDPTAIRLTVVQPRDYRSGTKYRTWTVNRMADLRQHWQTLYNAASAAMQSHRRATPGPEQCEHCPGRHACDALADVAAGVMDVSGTAGPTDLTPNTLGRELRALDRAAALLDARRTGLQAQALGLIRSGQTVPFYAVERGSGRETWEKPIAEVLALGQMMGVDLAKPPAAVTPNQARKAGLDPALVGAFAVTPPGELRLVADDGRRAREVFK